MAAPRHCLFRIGHRPRASTLVGERTASIAKMIWFRRHRIKGKHMRDQEQALRARLAKPKPVPPISQEPLDRSKINEAINKHGWIEWP